MLFYNYSITLSEVKFTLFKTDADKLPADGFNRYAFTRNFLSGL